MNSSVSLRDCFNHFSDIHSFEKFEQALKRSTPKIGPYGRVILMIGKEEVSYEEVELKFSTLKKASLFPSAKPILELYQRLIELKSAIGKQALDCIKQKDVKEIERLPSDAIEVDVEELSSKKALQGNNGYPLTEKLIPLNDEAELFLKTFLPVKMRDRDFPESIKVLKANPISPDLVKTYVTFLKQNPALTLIDFLAQLPGPVYYPVIKELMANGMPISKEALNFSLRVANYKVLDLLLTASDSRDLLKVHSKIFLKELLYSNDVFAAEKLYAKGLDLSSALALVEKEMGDCEYEILEWLFQKGVSTSDQKLYDSLIQHALIYKNLRAIRLISEKAGDAKITKVIYPDVLKLDHSNAEQQLKGFILCSPLSDVYALAKATRLEGMTSELLKYASYFVRFPKHSFREQINKDLKDMDTYIKASWQYAEENYKFVQSTKGKQKDMCWQKLLATITLDRYDRMPIKNEDYKTMVFSGQVKTPLVFNVFGAKNQRRSRYEPVFRDLSKMLATHEIVLDNTNNQLHYSYVIPETKEVVQMTQLDMNSDGVHIAIWRHTKPSNFKSLIPHIDKLHKEILDYDLQKGTKKELVAKIARCYWLIATMCQIKRGTPHNAMQWLNSVYNHHGLKAPIPLLKDYFLDNIALKLPEEMFVKLFETFLEPAFDPQGDDSQKSAFLCSVL